MVKADFKILGKCWTIRALKKSKYNKKNGKDSVAVTKMHKRCIDLGPKGCDLESIVHELVHAYLYEMCLHSTNELTIPDLEEVFAELMAKRGYEILHLAESLMTTLSQETEPS